MKRSRDGDRGRGSGMPSRHGYGNQSRGGRRGGGRFPRGGGGGGRGGGRFRQQQDDAPIEAYYSPTFLQDPWLELMPGRQQHQPSSHLQPLQQQQVPVNPEEIDLDDDAPEADDDDDGKLAEDGLIDRPWH